MEFNIYAGEKKLSFPEGSTLMDVAGKLEAGGDILLMKYRGKLCELSREITSDGAAEPVTYRDKPGMQTYERSAVLLFMKAFYDTAGTAAVDRVCVEFSTGNGLYISAKGDFELNEELISKVKLAMQSMVEHRIPIIKKNISTDEAKESFRRYRMYDKEKLFRFRRVSRVNIYSLGGFEDYFYGYMLPDTGYIKYFDLKLYNGGIVLILPNIRKPFEIPEFTPAEKVFEQLYASTVWGEKLGLADVGSLNEEISAGKTNDMILIAEAMMEKRIGDIAADIAERKGVKLIMIAGPSSSGKTTFSHRLSVQLRALGLKPRPIEVDNYFKNRADTPKDENGNYNFETIDAIDIEKLNADVKALLAGERLELPKFNFKTGVREYRGDYLCLGTENILVLEGIHCLNDALTYALPSECKYKVYISALTQLNVDEHNRIPTTDGRLLRRMVRDARMRGTSAENTIKMWSSVRRGEEEYIFPFQDSADVVFNSALIYELAVIKQYAEPLLFGISKDSEAYIEAKRLLKFLDYFIGIPTESIPGNSILREFIGGSCFNV